MKRNVTKMSEIALNADMLRHWYLYKHEAGADLKSIDEEIDKCFSKLMKKLQNAKEGVTTSYEEPIALNDIKKLRPKGPRKIALNLSDKELYNKILGGWLGRAAGCILGIPVEGMDRWEIIKFCDFIGQEYPLKDYFIDITYNRHKHPHYGVTLLNDFTRDRIKYVGTDDDLAYLILNLVIMEKYGIDFTSEQAGKEWVKRLPVACTAEDIALKNMKKGIMPPESGMIDNPYSEWIGADIRSDLWGYVSPGLPEISAEFAYRDASISHIKNGTYGEMFFSAMIAAAFAERDIEKLIEIALSEIPKNCRVAEAVKSTVSWYRKSGKNWEKTWEKIDDRYGYLNMADTLQNACFTILGLLHGNYDYSKTIAYTVMAGDDTDCTAATAGSILGVILGADKIPEQWTKNFNDRIVCYVKGMEDNKISDLAKRTQVLAKKVLEKYA